MKTSNTTRPAEAPARESFPIAVGENPEQLAQMIAASHAAPADDTAEPTPDLSAAPAPTER